MCMRMQVSRWSIQQNLDTSTELAQPDCLVACAKTSAQCFIFAIYRPPVVAKCLVNLPPRSRQIRISAWCNSKSKTNVAYCRHATQVIRTADEACPAGQHRDPVQRNSTWTQSIQYCRQKAKKERNGLAGPPRSCHSRKGWRKLFPSGNEWNARLSRATATRT